MLCEKNTNKKGQSVTGIFKGNNFCSNQYFFLYINFSDGYNVFHFHFLILKIINFKTDLNFYFILKIMVCFLIFTI